MLGWIWIALGLRRARLEPSLLLFVTALCFVLLGTRLAIQLSSGALAFIAGYSNHFLFTAIQRIVNAICGEQT
jgi:hypothetical protein